MAALASDITPAKRAATIVETSNSALLTRYPNARDGRENPAEGFFDDRNDAATALGVRTAIIGVVRRRWAVPVADLIQPNLANGIPCWTLVDAEQSVNAVHLICRMEVDFETETTGMELLA